MAGIIAHGTLLSTVDDLKTRLRQEHIDPTRYEPERCSNCGEDAPGWLRAPFGQCDASKLDDFP